MKFFFTLILFSSCLFININGINSYHKQLLLQNWSVYIFDCPKSVPNNINSIQLQTDLPTTIHLDLLRYNKIQDPFFSNNWQKQKWISQCSVKYQRKFDIKSNIMENQQINLVFQGIDTYSNIKLNGNEILTTNNSFVQYKANVYQLLKIGQNHLQITIKPTKLFDEQGQHKNKMPFAYAHTRKPAYQYSWDWAPQMNTLGIHKDIYLQYYQMIKIDYVWIRLQSLKQEQAQLNFAVKLNIDEKVDNLESFRIVIQDLNNGNELQELQVQDEDTYLLVKIKKPRLWWPNGIGEPYMYDFRVVLYSEDKEIHSKAIPYGIRTVQLDQTDHKFTVIVNNYKIYCKGSNYVPLDMLYPRLFNKNYKNSSSGMSITSLLQSAISSNFNMLRIWGGGQYQSSQFYQQASRLGIMLFHDFMFSDSIYPSTEKFIQSIQIQIIQQIRRIRNYPCLILWAGNNQILQGIQSWGWGSQKYREDYKKVFEEIIPNIVKNQSPYVPYIASSPVNGVGNAGFQRGGDVHYWGVWAAGSMFESYQTAIGPFNSEFGTQSLPVWQTIKTFTHQQSRKYSSLQLLSHQRHRSKFSIFQKYISEYGHQSLSFQLQTYQSGIIQQYALQLAVKSQRISKINNLSWGTLIWQLNDAWPGISWSSIDYYGRYKPLQYKLTKLYNNIICLYRHLDGKVYVINDNLYGVNLFVEYKIVKFDGYVVRKQGKYERLRENQGKQLFRLNKTQLDQYADNVVVYTKVVYGNKPQQSIGIANFIKRPKQLKLPSCKLNIIISLSLLQLTLSSQCLQKSIYIYHPQIYLKLSDNYVDVVPGFEYKTKIIINNGLMNQQQKEKLIGEIKFRSYRQVYEKEEMQVEIVRKQ